MWEPEVIPTTSISSSVGTQGRPSSFLDKFTWTKISPWKTGKLCKQLNTTLGINTLKWPWHCYSRIYRWLQHILNVRLHSHCFLAWFACTTLFVPKLPESSNHLSPSFSTILLLNVSDNFFKKIFFTKQKQLLLQDKTKNYFCMISCSWHTLVSLPTLSHLLR